MWKPFISLVEQWELLELAFHVTLALHLLILLLILNAYNYHDLLLVLLEVNLLLKSHSVVLGLIRVFSLNLALWKLEHLFLNRLSLNPVLEVLQSMASWNRVDEYLAELELSCPLLLFLVDFLETRGWSLQGIVLLVVIIELLNCRISLSEPSSIFSTNHHAFYLILFTKGVVSL